MHTLVGWRDEPGVLDTAGYKQPCVVGHTKTAERHTKLQNRIVGQRQPASLWNPTVVGRTILLDALAVRVPQFAPEWRACYPVVNIKGVPQRSILELQIEHAPGGAVDVGGHGERKPCCQPIRGLRPLAKRHGITCWACNTSLAAEKKN